ncbi:VOC family protein [Chitinophaga sp.]|uniref:VOC family protein n=1 Tax=Chitinophaga sp. TaxID=1869181 RepID=UPI0031DC8935
MATKIFINLPVKDLKKTVEFFTALGFTFNAQFTDEKATCMIVDENIFVMLLVEKYFQTFTSKPVADATRSTEVITFLSIDSREKVDELVDKALAAGATKNNEPQDMGWMYQRSFADINGHMWEIGYMDESAVPQE